MASATEWRSPLSILMGARRNDDIDLELREDYFQPRALPVPAAATAEAIDTETQPSPTRNPPPASYSFTSYIPFRYFGLKSPAPPSSQNTSLHPPRGAFPPPIISDSSMDVHDEAEFPPELVQDHPRQFSAYNPNITHSSSHHDVDCDHYTNRANNTNNDRCNTTASVLSWREQKAIIQTTLNFANSIIGPSLVGIGGAFAASGGGVSILMLIGFAPLTKLSFDLVVDLSSCPSVIERAVSKERNHNRHRLETDSHVSSDHIDDRADDSDEETTDLRTVPSENNEIEDTSACPDNFMKTVDSSPLMARDEEEDHTYETRDLFRTPSKSLVSSDKCNLATEDVTQRRLSSLQFETNDSSKNATPALEYNNSFRRPCCGYEDVGYAAFGSSGCIAVLVSKFMYAFGCLVAFVVVVRDNFGVSVRGLTFGPSSSNNRNVDCDWLYDDNYLALLVSAIIMLPLSCSRTMTSMSLVSFASILSTLCLMVIVAYMFFTCTNAVGRQDKSFYENWIEVRSLSSVIQSLGCFAFTYVGHHTVNPAYESLPLPIRNPKTWRRISTNAMILALEASLGVGVFAYLTFGSQAPLDVVSGYPGDLTLAYIARLLLCLIMALTFPLPFLTCRETCTCICADAHNFYYMHELNRYRLKCSFLKYISAIASSILSYVTCTGNKNRRILRMHRELNNAADRQNWMYDLGTNDEIGDAVNRYGGEPVTEPLLSKDEHEANNFPSIGGQRGKEIDPSPLSSRSGDPSSSESTISSTKVPQPSWILPHSDGKQLTILWHAVISFLLWFIATMTAICGPSLIDVLQLIGAFTGTMIAFVLPALFSFKLKGYNCHILVMMVVGGAAGILGTIYSLRYEAGVDRSFI